MMNLIVTPILWHSWGHLSLLLSDGANAVKLGGFLQESGGMPRLDTIRDFFEIVSAG